MRFAALFCMEGAAVGLLRIEAQSRPSLHAFHALQTFDVVA